jgi:hypothetical protein
MLNTNYTSYNQMFSTFTEQKQYMKTTDCLYWPNIITPQN